MKLSELKSFAKPVAESAMSNLHLEKTEELMAAIKDELDADDDMAEKIVAYLMDNEDDEEVDDFLYNKFESEMPYGVKNDDPKDWIANHMASLFKKEMKALQ